MRRRPEPFADLKHASGRPPSTFDRAAPEGRESLRARAPRTAELSYDPAIKFLLRLFASVLAMPTAGHAQSGVRPQPTQTPTRGVERLFKEGAHLPVFNAAERGRLDPSLEIPDVPPPAMSVRPPSGLTCRRLGRAGTPRDRNY